jgi:hypothetical protein
MIAANTQHLSPADRKFGYEFGAEGVVSLKTACEMLDMHRGSVWRLYKAGLIRRNNIRSKPKFCRRSILNYLKSTEG